MKCFPLVASVAVAGALNEEHCCAKRLSFNGRAAVRVCRARQRKRIKCAAPGPGNASYCDPAAAGAAGNASYCDPAGAKSAAAGDASYSDPAAAKSAAGGDDPCLAADVLARWFSFVPFRGTLFRCTIFLRPYFAKVLGAWGCAALSVSALYAFVPRVGELSSLLCSGSRSRIARTAAAASLLVAVRSLAQYWQQVLLWDVSLSATCDLRAYVFDAVLQKEMEFFEGPGTTSKGEIAYRVTAEADTAGDTIYALLNMVVPCFLQLGAMAGRMVSLSPALFLATVSMIPCMSLVIGAMGEQLRSLSRRSHQSIACLSSYLNEVLPSMLIVKACAAEAFEEQRFRNLALTDREAHLAKRKMKALIPEVITAAYAVTGVLLFAVGACIFSKRHCGGTEMVSFMTSLVMLVEPIQKIGKAYNEIKQGEPAVDRLFALVPSSSSGKAIASNECDSLEGVAGDVAFVNVSFSYDGSTPVLSNINLHVRAGETIALVGPSGGGKTTVAKLLLRLYDPVQGDILIDGRNMKTVSLKSLRQRIGVVPQETILFSGTVTENIAYGVLPQDIDMIRVRNAARQANAEEFISRLSEGYDTKLGEDGSGLSGGQRQRLAIARAIYHQPAILILDEATSALDNNSEKLVSESLERLMLGRTVFVIAHRLQTIQKANRIAVLDGGRLVEEGTHRSLLQQGGRYASLFSSGDAASRWFGSSAGMTCVG